MSTDGGEIKPRVAVKRSYKCSKTITFDYTWRIEKFSRESKYESPIFSPECNENLKCFLKYDGSSSQHFHLCVQPCNVSLSQIVIRIFVVTTNGYKSEVCSVTTSCSLSPEKVTEYECAISKNTTELTYRSGCVDINCLIKLLGQEISTLGNLTRKIEATGQPLADDIQEYVESPKFSDVMIDIHGHEFPAHKVILSARSRVFAAMFEHKMAEHQTSTVNITDIEPNVFKEILRYIYTDKVLNIETMPDKLLIAAEKYDLKTLKLLCEEVLRKNLTIENAADTLILADSHNATQLKEQALDFIVTKAPVMKEQQNFQSMIYSHPSLIHEILQASIKLQ